ncbi:MAG: hypothetical protein K9H13_02695, partial [Bacteroidales bacterium]|nr:hypothetical protein [Bacteroidales bacterium]
MKTKIFLLAFLVISVCGFSQNITDQKTFDQNELSIIQDRSYDRLIYTDASYAVPVGAPELPTFVYRYVIPYDMKVDDITINNISTTTLAGTYNVYPKQPPLLMDSIPDTSFKGPDPIYYELTEYPAQVVNKVMEPYPFGYHIVEVKIFPVQYKPLDQLLVFNNSIDFTINLVPNPDAPQKPYRQTIKSHNMICDMLAGQVENPDSISTSGGGAINLVDNGVVSPGEINPLPSNSGIIPEHIIITSEALAGSFSALAEWKCKLGYPSVIVTKEQISQNYFGVDEAEQIRNYLKDVHQHWGPGLYILLGGDVEIIQERMVLNYGDEIRPSDFYYATTSGNWNLDRDDVFGEDEDIDDEGYDISQVFFVGRAPVNTDNEVGIFINKLIGYEQMSQLQGSELEYVNNSLEALAFLYPSLINNKLLSYNPINCFINIYNQEASNNINFYYLADRFACEEELFEYNQFEYQLCDENCPDIEPVNGDELSSESFGLTLDQGVINYPGQYFHLVYHFDHSGPWSLGTSNTMKNEALKVDRVKTLSNGNYQQVIFSSGCNSNEFHRNDCIGEEFVLNPNGGSVSYIGGTSAVPCNTYKKAGDFITTLYKYDRTNVQIGNVISESIYTDSEIEFELKKLFSLLGDPSMKIWTNTPDHMGSLGLTCASSIPIGENQMQITVSNLEYGCRGIVTIYKHQDVYAYREITGNGNAITVDFTISPNTAGSMHVTVSAFEHKPVTQSVTVTDIIDPYLYISDHDLFGWNYLKAGHEHNLKIELSNSGGQATAGNLSADIAALSLEESFENQWLPAGWDQGEVVNMEWTQHQLIDPPGIEAPSGYKFIGCNTSDGQNGEGQTLTTPSVPITTDDFSISFYMYHDDQTPNDELELWSGTSYLGSFLRNDGSIGWKHEVLQVPGLAGNEASFKFIAKGYGGNDIYIDHVKIGSAFVNLTSSTSTYDQILSEGTGWNLTDFTLNAHNNSPPNTDVIFKLTAIDQVDQSRYQDNIHFEIHPPQLEMNANYITYTSFPSNPMDSAYGSNPLSGEIVHFLVEIINNGKTKIDFDDSQMILEDATPPGEVSYIESIDYTNVSFPSPDPKSISVPKNPFVIELKPIPYDNTSIKMDLTLKDVDGTEWIIPIDLYRIPRIQSDHIYTSSTFNQIKLTWDQPGSSNAGYVIYRYEETDGGSGNNEHHYIENYTRLTDFIHKYNYYIDEDVDADKIYYYKIAAIKKGGFSNPYWGAFGYWTNAVKASLQPYENGWPIHLNNKEVLGWTNKGATQTYDIDNNGDKEIFLSLGGNDEHGSIIGLNHIIEDGLTSHEVYNSDPDNYNGFVEFDCDYLSDIAFAEIVPGNDEIEIIANTNGGGTSSSDRRSVFVHSPGGFVAGEGYPPVLEWQKENAGLFSRGAVIDNIDGLGGDEILVKNEWGDQLYILNNTAPNNEFLNLSIPEAKGNGMPLILDLDNNGNKEFVYGFRDSDDFEGGVYAYDYLGNDFFTYTNTSAIPHHFDCIPAACDLNNDGEYEIILLSWVPDNKKYHVFALDRLGNEIQNWGYAGHIIDGDRNIYPAISLADLDEDGNIEVLLFTVGKLYAWKNDGTSFWPGMDYVPIEGEHADG